MAFVASRSSMRFELLRDGLLRAFAEGCEVGWGTPEALRGQAFDGITVPEMR